MYDHITEIAYNEGYDMGLHEGDLDLNHYDNCEQYQQWHVWNDGFFDGFKEYLSSRNEKENNNA